MNKFFNHYWIMAAGLEIDEKRRLKYAKSKNY